jgi:hypothetical protein
MPRDARIEALRYRLSDGTAVILPKRPQDRRPDINLSLSGGQSVCLGLSPSLLVWSAGVVIVTMPVTKPAERRR